MKPSLVLAIAGLLSIALITVPAFADNQAAIANQVGGSQDTQITTNNEYNTLSNQNTGAVQIGSGNTQTTTSTTIINNGGTVGTTTVSSDPAVNIYLPASTYDSQLSLENTESYLTTIYANKPFPEHIGIVASGDEVIINYSAGSPLLPEIIATSDLPRALNDATAIPTYDSVNMRIDHGSLTTYPLSAMASFNGGLSRNNEIVFTAPKVGDYTLVLWPGTSINIEPAYPSGQQPQISGNMIDLTIYDPVIIQCGEIGSCPVQSGRKIIGTSNQYPIDPETGRAET